MLLAPRMSPLRISMKGLRPFILPRGYMVAMLILFSNENGTRREQKCPLNLRIVSVCKQNRPPEPCSGGLLYAVFTAGTAASSGVGAVGRVAFGFSPTCGF